MNPNIREELAVSEQNKRKSTGRDHFQISDSESDKRFRHNLFK